MAQLWIPSTQQKLFLRDLLKAGKPMTLAQINRKYNRDYNALSIRYLVSIDIVKTEEIEVSCHRVSTYTIKGDDEAIVFYKDSVVKQTAYSINTTSNTLEEYLNTLDRVVKLHNQIID